jgi:hypothetical protein
LREDLFGRLHLGGRASGRDTLGHGVDKRVAETGAVGIRSADPKKRRIWLSSLSLSLQAGFFLVCAKK